MPLGDDNNPGPWPLEAPKGAKVERMSDPEFCQSAESSNRIAYYRRGYGDGAKGSAYRHAKNEDYMRGYSCGSADLANSVRSFCEAKGLPLPTVTR